jgi:glycosyltransferase involved in cell wall biosynthesis
LIPFDAYQLSRSEPIDRVLLLDAYAPLLRVTNRVRYAALVHDVLPLSHQHYWPSAKRTVKRIAYWSLRRGVTLFTSTAFNASQIQAHLGLDARVVEFGCGQLRDAEADAALEGELPSRDPYLIYVGAFEARKNVISLIDIVELILDEGLDLRLVLLGDGPPQYSRMLEGRIAVARHPERYEIVRGRQRKDVLELVANATAMVMPTRAEGFCLPVLEALALGTPVIANDITAIRSWAGDTVSYARVEAPADWVSAVHAALAMGDVERRRRQALTRRFRWRRCAEELSRF